MSMTARELDLREMPASQRHPTIFETFDRLADGESFVLINDHDPRPLYYQFRAERTGRFGWCPTLRGPSEWRVEITKLKPKDAETEVGVFFQRDHQEIDVVFGYLMQDLKAAVADPNSPTGPIANLFDDFDSRLERHIRWEEEVLFPEVERKEPQLEFGPGRVMRSEHKEIRQSKRMAFELLHEPHPNRLALANASRYLEEVHRILLDHNLKEEQVYYPMADQMFSEAEAGSVLARVKAIG